MQKVRGIGGLFFKCNNPEKLATWYKDNLGFELEAPFCASFNPQLAQQADKTVWGAFKNESEYFAPSRQRFMFNFIVDDVQAMLDQVCQAGARQVGDIETEDYGDFGWFIDPEGFKVELWSPKQISAQS
ncbi:VOC family protein [Marinicella gelatinilytica]|uniref:VOC family protein n=1 Tax=Marinicella gelatinilytica TaxID=2996017 RepID=UPI002260DAC4|nr:VOC family protein [Marinicella gelatinilytica]MCX7543908.1 VOC family protein [Marinicella gelatinilytica]